MKPSRGRPWAAGWVFAVLAALIAVACGTRVDEGTSAEVSVPGSGPSIPMEASTPPVSEPNGIESRAGARSPHRDASESRIINRTAGGSAEVAVPGPTPDLPLVTSGSQRQRDRPLRDTPAAATSDTPSDRARLAPRASPAVFATVGNYSGPAAIALVAIVQALQVWVKVTNAKGGLNGHPVELLVYDDGNDPARARALTQQAVERDHAIAFLDNVNPLTGAATADYITAKRVPVVGIAGAEAWVYQSPMFFPQAATSLAYFSTAPPGFARQALLEGKTRIGTLQCVEVTDCAHTERVFAEQEKGLGYHYVYRAKSSLANPDFTAECLAARNAGVEALFIVLDPNSVGRVAAACARQAYRPLYGIMAPAPLDSMKDNPDLDGTIAISNGFPYFQRGTAATDEFQLAMSLYGGNIPRGIASAVGWTAAKLMEKATLHLPEPPTSESILAALWNINGDDLGGLTYPLTFTRDQPPKPVSCWFTLAIKQASWISPSGGKIDCVG